MNADIKKKIAKSDNDKDAKYPENGNNNKAGKADSRPRPNNPAKNADLKSPDGKSKKLKA